MKATKFEAWKYTSDKITVNPSGLLLRYNYCKTCGAVSCCLCMIGKIKQTKVSIQSDPKKYAKLFHFEGLLYKMLEKQNHLTICAINGQSYAESTALRNHKGYEPFLWLTCWPYLQWLVQGQNFQEPWEVQAYTVNTQFTAEPSSW